MLRCVQNEQVYQNVDWLSSMSLWKINEMSQELEF